MSNSHKIFSSTGRYEITLTQKYISSTYFCARVMTMKDDLRNQILIIEITPTQKLVAAIPLHMGNIETQF